jgi:hypothetical protein
VNALPSVISSYGFVLVPKPPYWSCHVTVAIALLILSFILGGAGKIAFTVRLVRAMLSFTACPNVIEELNTIVAANKATKLNFFILTSFLKG